MKNVETVVFHDGNRYLTAIKAEGTKWITLCIVDCPVQLVKRPIRDKDNMTVLRKMYHDGKNLDVKTSAKMYLKSAKHLGITEGAKKFLKEVLQTCIC